MYLCCDLGGSKAAFSIFDPKSNEMLHKITHQNKGREDFYDVLEEYLTEIHSRNDEIEISHATIAAAGPIDSKKGNVVLTRGTRWEVETREIDEMLKDDFRYSDASSSLINDFQALGYGLLFWDDIGTKEGYFENVYGELITTSRRSSRRERRTNRASSEISIVCGPGTGLGVSCLVNGLMKDGYPYVITSEGGHSTFAPEKQKHLKFLKDDDAFQKRSFENALSGPGMTCIYNALSESSFNAIEPHDIVSNANENRDEIAVASLDFFCEALAVFCGNMALTFNCNKAIYLWGSTLDNIRITHLRRVFEEIFPERKHKEKLATIAVVRVLNKDLPLYGCANYSKCFLENVSR